MSYTYLLYNLTYIFYLCYTGFNNITSVYINYTGDCYKSCIKKQKFSFSFNEFIIAYGLLYSEPIISFRFNSFN